MLKHIRIFSAISFCLFSSFIISEVSQSQQKLLENLPPDQRDSIMEKMNTVQSVQTEIDESFEQSNTLIERPLSETRSQLEACPECIYGYDFFIYSPTTFAPSNNIPISSNYILGPGDKIEISYFGSYKEQSEEFISREGVLKLPLLPPVNLLGMTYSEAVALIEGRVKSELLGTSVSVVLKDLRSISIYLLGQAYKPGNYTVSGLSTVTNALFVSGGVNKVGSLRNIEIRRDGKIIKIYDFYNFLLKGEVDSDVRLQDGDIVFIPYIQKKVKIGNGFKGPHLYEVKQEETIGDLVKMAGGFRSGVTDNSKLEYSSFDKNNNKRFISYLSQNSTDLNIKLNDGDVVNIAKSLSLESATIEISGEVNRPGEYTILEGDTILDIIDRAGGYSDNSFPEGAIFTRESVAKLEKEGFERVARELEELMIRTSTKTSYKSTGTGGMDAIISMITKLRKLTPLGRQVVDVDYLKLKTDPFLNFRLQNSDALFIPKRPEAISVIGEVLNPSVQMFSPSSSVAEYINLAGGLKSSADKKKIYVVLPNGEAFVHKKSWLNRDSEVFLPGSTIVVIRGEYANYELATVLTPVIASMATTITALAVLNKD